MLILFLIILTGCFFQTPKPPEPSYKTITIIAKVGEVDSEMAVGIDIVQIFSQELLGEFLKMEAETFADKKPQLLLDFPNSFRIFRLEVMPDQKTKCFNIPKDVPYWGIVGFIHKKENDKNRFVFPSLAKHISLQINSGILRIEETEGDISCVDF